MLKILRDDKYVSFSVVWDKIYKKYNCFAYRRIDDISFYDLELKTIYITQYILIFEGNQSIEYVFRSYI